MDHALRPHWVLIEVVLRVRAGADDWGHSGSLHGTLGGSRLGLAVLNGLRWLVKLNNFTIIVR